MPNERPFWEPDPEHKPHKSTAPQGQPKPKGWADVAKICEVVGGLAFLGIIVIVVHAWHDLHLGFSAWPSDTKTLLAVCVTVFVGASIMAGISAATAPESAAVEASTEANDWDAIAYIGGAALLIFLAIGGYCEWQHIQVAALPLVVQLIGKAAVFVFIGCIAVQGVRHLFFKKAKSAQSAPPPQNQPRPGEAPQWPARRQDHFRD